MKNIIDEPVFQQVIYRLGTLKPESKSLWGKMNVSQMLAHCAAQIKLANGELKGKPLFPPFMQFIAKQSFGFIRSLPTAPEMAIVNPKLFQIEISTLTTSLENFCFQNIDANLAPHPIFGKMSKEEWGKIIYKHLNHHFKQFGA